MKKAAEELHVTAGAVSLQIKTLEAFLGLTLFLRQPRSLELTREGHDYFASLRIAFRLMQEATAAIKAGNRQEIVVLSCTTGFAIQWLLPRLEQFNLRHPEIDLRIGTTGRLVDFDRDGIDLAVRHGLGVWKGLVSERLVDDDMLVVCSPDLARTLGNPARPEQLQHHTLIHDVSREDWRLWLEANGLKPAHWKQGPVIAPDSNGALEAARAGLGFALMRSSFIEHDLREKRLIAPFPASHRSQMAYYLAYPATSLQRTATRQVRDWLMAEASAPQPPEPNEM